MLKYLFGLSIALYLMSTIISSKLDLILSIICFIIVISTLFFVKSFVRVLGLLFLLLGFYLLFINDAGWKDYIISFGPMLNLLTLFALIPILALPIKLGNYAIDIQHIVQRKVKTSGHLYMMTSGISYFFSIFMNLATLPMTYYSMKPALNVFPLQNNQRFMSRAITHGFAMPLLWAPVTPIVGIVIEMTGVSWASMLPYVIPLSLAGLMLDWMLGMRHSTKNKHQNIHNYHGENETAVTLEVDYSSQSSKRILQIFLAILIFNIVISILEYVFPLSLIILVSLIVIPFSFCWSVLLKKTTDFKNGLKGHFQAHLLKMKEQFFIFLSAGFFISAVKFSGTDKVLNIWISDFKNLIGVEIFLFIIPVIPLLFAFTGLHPAVALALMAEALDPASLGLSPLLLTVSMLGGAVSAFLMGPYNATIGLMSSIVNQSPFKISNWNISFTSIYLGFVMIYLFALELFLQI